MVYATQYNIWQDRWDAAYFHFSKECFEVVALAGFSDKYEFQK